MQNEIIIEAPAKINLTLDIKGKRKDNYHELETIMHQVNLLDRIHLSRGGEGIQVTSNNPVIPGGKENLAYRAAELMYISFGIKEGIKIFIEKNIPVGAGLAGGSTDAAAVMQGINTVFSLNIEQDEMLKLGEQIGSDLPFCILGGTAIARGRGEKLSILEKGPGLDILLVKPDFSLSTAEIYQDFKPERVKDFPDNTAFVEAWQNHDIIRIALNMKNVLESVSIHKTPEIQKIKKMLCGLGALNAVMTGSGPTVVGIFADHYRADEAYKNIKDQYAETYLVRSYL